MRNVYKINAKVGGVGPSSKPDDVVYKAADKPHRIKSKIFPFFFSLHCKYQRDLHRRTNSNNIV